MPRFKFISYPEDGDTKMYTPYELLNRSLRRLEQEPQYDDDRPAWGNERRQLQALRDTFNGRQG